MQQANVDALMERADLDEISARILLEYGGPEPAIGFHCQQAVEKMLKAVLVARGVNPPKTHDILLLKQQFKDIGEALPPEFVDLDLLNPYGVAERYADSGVTGLLDMHHACGLVGAVRTWALARLGGSAEDAVC